MTSSSKPGENKVLPCSVFTQNGKVILKDIEACIPPEILNQLTDELDATVFVDISGDIKCIVSIPRNDRGADTTLDLIRETFKSKGYSPLPAVSYNSTEGRELERTARQLPH